MQTPARPAGARPALDYPLAVAAMLWPAPSRVVATRRTASATPSTGWLVLPSARRPRLLVPVGVPAAARMLTRHGDRPGPRAVRAALAAGVRTGLLERLPVQRLVAHPAAASLAEQLEPALGPGLAVGALLGTPRVNRKPVLQVFDPAGRTVAFVKVGHDDHTRELVRREADNLARVGTAGVPGVEPPQVLHAGPVDDLEVLVLSPLASSQGRGRSGSVPPPLPAMAALATAGGTQTGALRDSPFAERLRSRSGAAPGGAGAARLAGLVAAVLDRHGGDEVDLGAWHGDWAPWNMGWAEGRLQLWDWERWAEGVPLGLDPVHFLAQRVRHDRPGLRAAEDALLGALPGLLPAVGVPAARARLTLVLYLLELAARFLAPEDGSAGTDHPRARWALDLADRLLTEGPPRDGAA